MAEHGTRTMYVHYGCRCDACCEAEHRQYLKRAEARDRKRTKSKWSDPSVEYIVGQNRLNTQRVHNANRYRAFKERPSTHTHPITWHEIADRYGMKCAFCGCEVNPEDTWTASNGRKCYGRTYPTVDHIIPLKCGGTDTLDNVQLACKHCNSAKGAKSDWKIDKSKQERQSP